MQEKYFPSAFFSAFTTLPSFEGNDNFIGEIGDLFKNYNDGLLQMQELAGTTPIEIDEVKTNFLYRPVPYYVFGEFDMAIISLIDDFSFATQHFKPKPISKGFKYQVNTGIIPMVESRIVDKSEVRKFKEKLIPEFFRQDTIYPFSAIASVKLNNAMLVGIGQDFLNLMNFFLVTWLDKKLLGDENEQKGHKFFYILNENLGWNELAIYIFGNSISHMQEQIMHVRQFTLDEIRSFIEGLKAEKSYAEKWIDTMLLIVEKICSESLLAKFIQNPKESTSPNPSEPNKFDPLSSHPFIATSVTYGFSPELIQHGENSNWLETNSKLTSLQIEIYEKECNQKGLISINWKIKPGHEFEGNRLIKECFPKYGGDIMDSSQSGKYQFQYPKESISIKDYLAFSKIALNKPGSEKSKHVLKVRSHLTWHKKLPVIQYDTKKHYQYNLESCRIDELMVKTIADKLCIYPVPYTFKNQIENLIINYNDAVTDSLMYNYFVGLKAPLLCFLENCFDAKMFLPPDDIREGKTATTIGDSGSDEYSNVIGTTDDYDSMTVSTLDIQGITEFIQAWNKAYWNRYFHSYYFTEINDFNIEHHGGIQQILFTYDTIYRLICKRIYGKHSMNPFINVQVVPNITSTQYYNTINFTHLFRPAIYACECVHEAANHILTYLAKKEVNLNYEFLFNPFGDRSGDDIQTNMERDDRLRKAVGPRDDYEKTYLSQHFGLNAIRHIITDFCTYVLGYADQRIEDKSKLWKDRDIASLKLFYHTHWLLFLVRSDLYDRENFGKGYWFFNETDFKVIFIRLNLMFYLFFDFTRIELEDLNRDCPSVELDPLWYNQSRQLLDFVVRLGDALEKEFQQQTSTTAIDVNGTHPEINNFRNFLVDKVLNTGWMEMKESGEGDDYIKAIDINLKIIKTFYEFFSQENKKCNILKRESAIDTTKLVRGKLVTTNVRFYTDTNRDVFLDPKGHLFSTSPELRQKTFIANRAYIKDMWDLSMKICKRDY